MLGRTVVSVYWYEFTTNFRRRQASFILKNLSLTIFTGWWWDLAKPLISHHRSKSPVSTTNRHNRTTWSGFFGPGHLRKSYTLGFTIDKYIIVPYRKFSILQWCYGVSVQIARMNVNTINAWIKNLSNVL